MNEAEIKAKELVDKFTGIFIAANADSWTYEAKQCAVICVDQIIELNVCWYSPELVKTEYDVTPDGTIEFWESVKQSITNQ